MTKRLNVLLHFVLLLALGSSIALASSAMPRMPVQARKAASPEPRYILVKFREGLAQGQRVMSAAGFAAKSQISAIGVQVIPVPSGRSAEEFLAELTSRYGTDLAYAEMDRTRHALKTPNDTFYNSGSLYYLQTIGCPAAWDTTTGSGITIAIADTGVMVTHPDLAAHLLPGRNVIDDSADVTDNVGHGTAVAGMAAAVGDNAVGVVGVAYNASILPIKISDDGDTTDSLIAKAIVYAADHGAKVVNVSFGADLPAPAGCWPRTVLDAASYMRAKGGLAVFAAGNAGFDKGCSNNAEIIDVAATDSGDQLAAFSNFGLELDVSAPGEAVGTTSCKTCTLGDGTNDYLAYDGTSFAAPVVAGVLALIYSVDQNFTADQAQQILFDSATDLGSGGYDSFFGWGRVNAPNAISFAAQRSLTFRLESLSNVYAYPNPWDTRRNANRQVTIANIPDDATVKLFTLSGFWIKTLPPSNGRATWDLTNQAGDPVASGLYFYLVTTPGHRFRGEIAIIK